MKRDELVKLIINNKEIYGANIIPQRINSTYKYDNLDKNKTLSKE